ncbi:hypothetical protein FRC12_015745 [Ceratobasidium sp. 428]|nr:hypothetical protein FRC12_015745 [Ceratobasidium sp. 428]
MTSNLPRMTRRTAAASATNSTLAEINSPSLSGAAPGSESTYTCGSVSSDRSTGEDMDPIHVDGTPGREVVVKNSGGQQRIISVKRVHSPSGGSSTLKFVVHPKKKADQEALLSKAEKDPSVPVAASSKSVSASRSASSNQNVEGGGKRRREDNLKNRKITLDAKPASTSPPLVSSQGDHCILIAAQDKRCNAYKNKETVSRCVSCTQKKSGDTCRFRGVRKLKSTPASPESVLDVSFGSTHREEVAVQPEYQLPTEWNTTPQTEHIDRIQDVIARALYPVLEVELEHGSKEGAFWRPGNIKVRVTCGCYMCTQCGRDVCSDCYEQISSSTCGGQQLPRKYFTCVPDVPHTSLNFRPVTQFTLQELEKTLKDMKSTIEKNSRTPSPENRSAHGVGVGVGNRPVGSKHVQTDFSGVPSHQINYLQKDATEDVFKAIWARGEAVVIEGLLDAFKIKWTPDYFVDTYGQDECWIQDCSTDTKKKSNVKAFFSKFDEADRENLIWKLKDWPPSADFRDKFPQLYDDFTAAVPIPNYTRRDGVLNLASHFATNGVAPDLGPKMYNAFVSSEAPGGQGSTRLHMDMADAVNIMMFASSSKGREDPGVAAWDIFRASDSDKIRAYLRREFGEKATGGGDPIHSQLFYLDSDDRKQLYQQENVYSWRIYQRPGDAVFIPAGCAHQVCNLANCIKVAVDFVSLENIDRCEKLTAEFRLENGKSTWKEDILQLRTMMMYAWRSTVRLRTA